MKATLMYGAGDVRIGEVPDPVIRAPADAIVRVVRAAICGSDLHPYRSMPAVEQGRQMGHEFLGIIEDTGAEVTGLKRGDLVLSPFTYADNTCFWCRRGLQTSCPQGGRYGFDGVDGGQGEAVRVPQAAGTLVKLPVAADSALLPSLMTLTDVFCTGHHAAVTAPVGPGASVAGRPRRRRGARMRGQHAGTLNNGVRIPILGFGVFQVPAEQTEQVVTDALAVGYRHLDTAAAYRNEEAVGRAIKASGIARDELFVTTKLWVHDGREDGTKRAFDASLRRLGLDYLDLYLIHQPYGDYYSSWRAMQDLHRQGLIRAIGVSNFYPDRLVDLIEHNEITPAVNQVETHPFFQRTDYQSLMAERGVQMESWGPLAEGRNNIFGDPTLGGIGEAHGKSVAQVTLRWLIQRGVVVIPKSVRPERMAENLDVFDFELTDEEMSRIAALDTGVSIAFDHRDPAMVTRIGSIRIDG